MISSGYGRVTDESVAASAAAASARHHDLTPAGLAAAARSAAAAAVEVTAAQVHKTAQKEGLVLVKARNETGFEGVCFRPSACALLSKPFKARATGPNLTPDLTLTRYDLDLTLSPTLTKARYEAGERIEHLGYFSSPEEGALAYARRLGPAACKAAAAAAKRAAPPAPPEDKAEGTPKKKKQKKKQEAGPQQTEASGGTSSDARLRGAGAHSRAARGAAGGGAAGSSVVGDGAVGGGVTGGAARLPAAEKRAPAQRTESEIAEEQAKAEAKAAADARLREQLMAAIVQARTRATLAGAPPPTAKELHAAVSEPCHGLPPTSLAAVKKCMSLLVAMQRAGTPQPAAGE